MLSWLRDRAARNLPGQAAGNADAAASEDPAPLDPEVLDCLMDLVDPEVGVSVVHLGLVYRAVRTPGRIEVDLTLTTRTCPLGVMLVEGAREHLRHRFNDCPTLAVRLVWSPTWTPDRITDQGLALLGHPPRHLS